MKNDKVESEVVSPGACAGVAPERAVQDRIIELLRTKLGYEYLGNLSERENSCLDRQALKEFLVGRQQLEPAYADRAIAELAKRMACPSQADLYSVNKEVYLTLRYPMPVATEPGKPMKQVYFIDWQHPLENNFSIAEEVTVRRQIAANGHRRPDVVIWVNGIALCVIELKKANVSVAEGIRQNYRNQQAGEIPAFFAAAQLLMAGNESEGLKYATTLTPEKYWLKWKEPCGGGGDFAARGEELGRTRPSAGQNPARGEVCDKAALFEKWGVKAFLDKAMLQMLDKERLLAFIHDGVVFDGGVKK